jgi:hypothetical protein
VEFCESKIEPSGSVPETETKAIQVINDARHRRAGRNQNPVVIKNRRDYRGSDEVAQV